MMQKSYHITSNVMFRVKPVKVENTVIGKTKGKQYPDRDGVLIV